MIYIETDSTDVYYNFALEYYFALEKKLEDTVFLFWRTDPTLMIGKYQNVLEEVNMEFAKNHGIHLVRRQSGGGTIYTDRGGWQFSFIQHGNENDIEFHQYIAPVIDALADMGVSAEFNGRNDLVIGGRKFSGNAQYRLGDTTVHHGSLLFDTDIEMMVASTTVDPHKIISKSIKSVRDRVTNVSEHLKYTMDVMEFKKRMIDSVMGENGGEYILTEEDNKRIREIAKEKFDNWNSLYGSNPKFNIEKTAYFAGGKMQIKMDVQKGIITNAGIYGDFFSTLDAKQLLAPLIGCKYDYDSVREAMMQKGIDGKVYRVSVEDMTRLIMG